MIRTVLAPLLSVRKGAEAVDFYVKALGAKVMNRMDDESGRVVAQLRLGESDFWVADESTEHLNFSPETLGGSTARMTVTVENPDALFDQAVAAGAKVVHPVADQP